MAKDAGAPIALEDPAASAGRLIKDDASHSAIIGLHSNPPLSPEWYLARHGRSIRFCRHRKTSLANGS